MDLLVPALVPTVITCPAGHSEDFGPPVFVAVSTQ
jgi:hypothetical protein